MSTTQLTRRPRHRAPDANGRTLLGVWAHPDDETFMSAGLMLEHIARGDRVVVITATLGEHGTDDPARWPPERLGVTRHRELRRCLSTLGVDELHVLGFEDGQCHRGDGTEQIARHIAAIEPDVIVTFGPEGMTGHPDHQAVSRWTTDAWMSSGTDAELWYATVTPEFHERWDRVNTLAQFWFDEAEPPSTPKRELRHSVTLTGHWLNTKVAALRAHRTQTVRLARLVGADALRHWWATESFRLARPAPAAHDRRAQLERLTR